MIAVCPANAATTVRSIVDAATFQSPLSLGSVFSIFGNNLAATETAADHTPLSTTLGGVSVTINGTAVPLLYVSTNQINGQIPYEIATGTAVAEVVVNGISVAQLGLVINQNAPRIFAGQGNVCVAQNEDGTLNSAANPAKPGHYIVAYLIGLGTVNPPVATGAAAPMKPLSNAAQSSTVSLGSRSLHPAYLGLTPASIGLGQLNVLIPPDLSAGLRNLSVKVGSAPSNTCLIAVNDRPFTPSALTITNASLPAGTVGTFYTAELAASGAPPYSWTVTSGSLPAGLALDSSSGEISGFPTISGTSSFTVWVTDGAGATNTTNVSATIASPPSDSGLWSAGMETGDFSEWYFPSAGDFGNNGGGEYNSGISSTISTTSIAHSGKWSGKMTIVTPCLPTSGTRVFRWREPRARRELFYSVWLYLPVLYKLTGDPASGQFFNLFQFKTRTADNSRIDPVWAFYLDNSQPDRFYLKAGFGWGGTQLAGPQAGDGVSGKWYYQKIAPLPVGQWVHLEAFLRQSKDYDGRLVLWQDGVKIFDFQNIITSYTNCTYNSWCTDDEWAIDLYSDGLFPNPATMYIDDAKIAATFVE